MTDEPIHVETVADLIRHGYVLNAWCQVCERSRRVDLRVFAARGGAHARPGALRLRCVECGGRQVSVTISPPRTY